MLLLLLLLMIDGGDALFVYETNNVCLIQIRNIQKKRIYIFEHMFRISNFIENEKFPISFVKCIN
jgi:hypothetical protein